VPSTLSSLTDKGDIIIDGGNTFFQDTIRRNRELLPKVLTSSVPAFPAVKKGLLKVLRSCLVVRKKLMNWLLQFSSRLQSLKTVSRCNYIGAMDAGHYVCQMVHNGIEYGDMQLIAKPMLY
jgi:6-phosphogluconate dehydrogenase